MKQGMIKTAMAPIIFWLLSEIFIGLLFEAGFRLPGYLENMSMDEVFELIRNERAKGNIDTKDLERLYGELARTVNAYFRKIIFDIKSTISSGARLREDFSLYSFNFQHYPNPNLINNIINHSESKLSVFKSDEAQETIRELVDDLKIKNKKYSDYYKLIKDVERDSKNIMQLRRFHSSAIDMFDSLRALYDVAVHTTSALAQFFSQLNKAIELGEVRKEKVLIGNKDAWMPGMIRPLTAFDKKFEPPTDPSKINPKVGAHLRRGLFAFARACRDIKSAYIRLRKEILKVSERLDLYEEKGWLKKIWEAIEAIPDVTFLE
jgi:hypothetical protein